MPDNRGDVVKVLPGRNASARVAIVRRPDGHYAIRPERWYERVFDDGVISARWIPLNEQSGIFASVGLAEKEAYADYPWVRPSLEEGPAS